jgi:hypothetical protein
MEFVPDSLVKFAPVRQARDVAGRKLRVEGSEIAEFASDGRGCAMEKRREFLYARIGRFRALEWDTAIQLERED